MALLTAIIPIGPKHRDANLISKWSDSANKYSDELKIIIVEDFGTDKTLPGPNASLRYGLKNSVSIRGNFNSPGISRNTGLSAAESPWVCFWDADDLPNVTNFLEMVRDAEETNFEITIGDFDRFSNYEHLTTEKDKKEFDIQQVIKEPGLWRMSFRRELIGKTRFEPIFMAEDQLFLLDLVFYKKHIYFHQKVVYRYQVNNPLQLTNSNSVNQIVDFVNLVKFRLSNNEYPTDKISEYMTARILVSGFAKLDMKYKFFLINSFLSVVNTNVTFGLRIMFRTAIIGSRLLFNALRVNLRQ